MGQPVHTLTAHVGKPQLWAAGTFTGSSSRHYGNHSFKLRVLTRVVFLFLVRPPFIQDAHWWQSSLRTLRLAVNKLRLTSASNMVPDLVVPFVWRRYYRVVTEQVLFKESDITLTESGYIAPAASQQMLWARARIFYVRNLAIILVRGLSSHPSTLERKAGSLLSRLELRVLWWEFQKQWRAPLLSKVTHAASKIAPVAARAPRVWL